VAAVLACGIGLASRSVVAQSQSAVVLVIDKDAIDHGPPPHLVPAEAVNDLIASVGVRDPLPFFASLAGEQFTLRSGLDGNDSWFAIRSIQNWWTSEPGADDGLQNFVLAGPGLGSPDAHGERESLLDAVPNVTPLRADGLRLLIGRQVCAVVYDNDLQAAPGSSQMSLKGVNLGIIAFQVSGLADDSLTWPKVNVQILNAREVCSGQLELFSQAPDVQ
jgi:hypothetical protein